jgi:hypothetical protein
MGGSSLYGYMSDKLRAASNVVIYIPLWALFFFFFEPSLSGPFVLDLRLAAGPSI